MSKSEHIYTCNMHTKCPI